LTDWRLPENRREAFQRSYTFSLKHQNFPGMVYSMLPAIADAFDLDDDGRAWLAWLNGNTQNVVTSMLLLEAAPRYTDWPKAIAFWNEHFKALEWDTDRRHQKNDFGRATEDWFFASGPSPSTDWAIAAEEGWRACWDMAIGSPFMGRISAWSYMEFARILLPFIPDVGEWFLKESSSRSHRNALCLLSGYDDAWGWDREQSDIPFMLDLLPSLHDLAEDLLTEADARNAILEQTGPQDFEYQHHPLVSRLTMESALCTFKSWHKPNRRYPNVYADMMYQRIKKAEARMGRSLDLLWDIRKQTLPDWLRLEDNPLDPGLSPQKQNCFRETGGIPLLYREFPDMEPSKFDLDLQVGAWGPRKDPKW
jgi:hypothetical protein